MARAVGTTADSDRLHAAGLGDLGNRRVSASSVACVCWLADLPAGRTPDPRFGASGFPPMAFIWAVVGISGDGPATRLGGDGGIPAQKMGGKLRHK